MDTQRCIIDCLECYMLCRQASRPGVVEDCHEICRTTADFLLRRSPHYREICELCAMICDAAARDLGEASETAECVRACRGCADSCRALL